MIDACTWNAGADRYTGDVPAAIAAYGLPLATQSALIRAFERREFVDAVVIDREAIRGKTAEYDSRIRAMHFGSRGRICAEVTRTGWAADHVETALVLCADGECIAWPAVCGNVFRITRHERAVADEIVPAELAADAMSDLAPEAQPLVLREISPEPAAGATAAPGEPGWMSWPEPMPAPWIRAPHTPPIPEPSTWALFVAGALALALRRVRR
ncbi:MAG TPA: MHFG family PEP-CTERM protein [Burkholderiaceae bacterium]|nr:MHFG family PEP-CTERM protein [Burkholderiaceae bacterium]